MNLRVLLVDDEPGALRFLAHMIGSRCPGWEVAGTAENGRQAIAQIRKSPPDMVLTDIRMPVLDGITLAKQIKQNWPDIRTAVISGYEDFSAAQNAIRFGVSDYLLKPVNPAQLVEVLAQARLQLLEQKRRDAAELLTAAVAGETLEPGQLERAFHTDRFQAAVLRAGSLPSRYSIRLAVGLRVFEGEGAAGGMPEHCWVTGGRDESELFLFQAAQPLCPLPLEETAALAARMLPEGKCTVILHSDAFSLSQAGEVASELLRLLDRSLVLGVSRTVGRERIPRPETAAPVDSALEQQVVGMCTGLCRTKDLRDLCGTLFEVWQRENRPLHYVMRDVGRLLGAIERGVASRRNRPADHEQPLDEVMLLSADMDELHSRVWNLIIATINQAEKQDAPPGSDAFFDSVRAYIEQNLAESITLQSLCTAMGISQTYMSRIFRRQTALSFSEYLTARRIERAKAVMREKPGLPLKTVAELVGYRDPFYFSKVFRAAEGIPPSRFISDLTGQGGAAYRE